MLEMTATIINAAGLVAVAGVFGAMAFFAFVYAPLVFIKLGTETGGRFIRSCRDAGTAWPWPAMSGSRIPDRDILIAGQATLPG